MPPLKCFLRRECGEGSVDDAILEYAASILDDGSDDSLAALDELLCGLSPEVWSRQNAIGREAQLRALVQQVGGHTQHLRTVLARQLASRIGPCYQTITFALLLLLRPVDRLQVSLQRRRCKAPLLGCPSGKQRRKQKPASLRINPALRAKQSPFHWQELRLEWA